ncbi:hypothetical protein ROZALSC1DRAFT_31143, partial [Rozella allomycis CSF55]
MVVKRKPTAEGIQRKRTKQHKDALIPASLVTRPPSPVTRAKCDLSDTSTTLHHIHASDDTATLPVENVEMAYPFFPENAHITYLGVKPTSNEMAKRITGVLQEITFAPRHTIRVPIFHYGRFPGHGRFIVNEQTKTVDIMYRPWMENILKEWAQRDAGSGVMLLGPQAYMKAKKTHRVLYLPNCCMLGNNSALHRELLAAFYDEDAESIIRRH